MGLRTTRRRGRHSRLRSQGHESRPAHPPRRIGRIQTGPFHRTGSALADSAARISAKFPGISVKETNGRWELVIPDSYKIGHEAHFRQVIERFIGFLEGKPVPAWEVPNTLTKYRTTMEAWRMSRKQ